MLREETQKRLSQHGVDELAFVDALRAIFPHGHEDFLPTTVKELELHSVKNHDYARGGDSLGNFNRVAAILALYPGLDLSDRRVIALVYAMKQLDAVLWGLAKKIVHKVEGLNDRLQDISVYSKIVMCMNTEDARNAEIDRQFGMDLSSSATAEEGPSLYRGAHADINESRVSQEKAKAGKAPELNHTRDYREDRLSPGGCFEVGVSARGVDRLDGTEGRGCTTTSERYRS